jgi:hypothetical protein
MSKGLDKTKANIETPLLQCCGSGIRCLFDPWIRYVFSGSRISDPEPIFLRA